MFPIFWQSVEPAAEAMVISKINLVAEIFANIHQKLMEVAQMMNNGKSYHHTIQHDNSEQIKKCILVLEI